MKAKNLTILIILLIAIPAAGAAQEKAAAPLDLETALRLALQHNPRLGAAQQGVQAAEAEASQLGALPNPRINWRLEAVGAEDPLELTERIIGIVQDIPIGGRTFAAYDVGAKRADQSRFLRDAVARDIRLEVIRAYFGACHQQVRLRTQERILKLVEDGLTLTRARLENGEIIESELAQAEIEFLREKKVRDLINVEYANSLKTLAFAIGAGDLVIASVIDQLSEVPVVRGGTAGLLEGPAARNPELLFARSAIEVEKAEQRQLQREAIPDLELSLSHRSIRVLDVSTYDVGLAISIPLFDRNQGAIAASRARQRAAELQLQAVEQCLANRSRQTAALLAVSGEQVVQTRDELLPRARRVLETAEVRYQAGDIDLSEVLRARRQFAQLEMELLDRQLQAWLLWVELESLVGTGDVHSPTEMERQ